MPRLLAVTCDLYSLGATVCVDSTGTRRRLQALGHNKTEIGRRLRTSGATTEVLIARVGAVA